MHHLHEAVHARIGAAGAERDDLLVQDLGEGLVEHRGALLLERREELLEARGGGLLDRVLLLGKAEAQMLEFRPRALDLTALCELQLQEARRLQRKRLAALRADDFLLPGATQERATAPSRAKVVFDDLSEFLNEPEPEHEHEQDDPLPQPEEDTEELLALLQDFKARLEMLRAQLVPLMAQARATGTNPGVGLTFLQAKYHVLLAYCASVAYYLLLKSRGARVAGHPVLRRLVRHRLLLEKLRPLEQKLRPHIEKALSAVAERAGGALRANPAALVVDGDADTDTDAQDTETAKEAPRAYRPPKLAPAHYPEDAPARDSTERLRRAASRSRLLAELRGELDDAPDEEASDPVRMATRAHTDAAALQRDAYEEQNFMRFQPSRRDRAALRTNARPLDELDDLDDFFGELDALNGAGAGAARPGARKRAAASIGAFLAAPPDAAPAHVAAPYAGSDESAVEDDAHVAPRAERKRARRAERLATRAALRPPVAHRPLRDLDAAAPRPASYAMLKNRGLAPTRSREQRNPRLKQRSRYERAVKRLSSARGGALRADTSRPYPGEATGIRTNLSKSVRFK